MENIQDKIRKLFALANDKSATEGEATNALAMATALMAKYNIDHIPDKSNVKGDRRTTGKLDNWQLWMMTVCARLNGCKTARGRLTSSFFGRPEDTAAAWEMHIFLINQIERLYKRDLPPRLSQSARANYRRTYKQACSIRLYERADEILTALRTQDHQISGCTALVVAQSFDQRMHEAEEFIRSQGMTIRTGKSRATHVGLGTFEGMRAGDEVKINEMVRT